MSIDPRAFAGAVIVICAGILVWMDWRKGKPDILPPADKSCERNKTESL